ncbi:MAG: LuxR C-terminal-related transcriptional regulator [Bacteroidales bacterium]|nr:LuxR C-terminal-related transcriptional regulator [Bacteroidales bacterium]MCF8457587.1 LuxR C-terminal-related transcriptional regulator [Bacteroidales bacterium]
MLRKIVIVHPSTIVRKGLEAIIKSFFNIDVLLFENVDSIVNLFNSSKRNPIVFADIEYSAPSLISKIPADDLIVLTSESLTQKKDGFKNHLSLFASKSDVQELVHSILKNPNTETTFDHEGEELSLREKDVLKLVALGHTNKEIAEALFISIHTVISHRKNITEKLGIKSISGLTVYAILNHIIDTSTIDLEKLI